jgi:hypothetical protein
LITIKLLPDSSATLFWLDIGEALFRKPRCNRWPLVTRLTPAAHAQSTLARRHGLPGQMNQILTDEERASLAVIASVARFKKGAVIYREGDPADRV